MRPLLLALAPLIVAAASALAGTAEPATYGATPGEMAPYRDTGTAYWRYFEAPPPYRGQRLGEKDAAGLTSVKIGLIAPIDHPVDAAVGHTMRQGAELAIEEANAAGGFRGALPFSLVVRNDAGLWGATSNTTAELAWDERVWGILGSVDGANTHIALRVALKAEVPIVNTACTDPTLTETAIPWIVRCYPDDRQHGYRLAQLLFRERGYRKVAILRSNDKYGRMGVAEFRDAARRLGFPIPLEMRFLPGEETFDAQLERIRRVGAEAVVLWAAASDAARIVTQMRSEGFTQPVFGNDRLVTGEFLALAGDAARGVVATTPMDPDRKDAEWLAFRERYAARFGEEPDVFATFTYDGTRLLLDAIRSAGLDRVGIRDTLAGIRTYDGVSGPMRFDATHNNLGQLSVLEVRDGRFESTGN